MANIDKELNQIKNAVYGREVRGSIHDGIDKINKETEKTTNEQETLSDQFKQLIIDAGNSNAEVVASRGKEDWLPDRLNSVDQQLAETAKQTDPLFKSSERSEDVQLGNELLDGLGWTSTGWTGDFSSGFIHIQGNTTPLVKTIPAGAVTSIFQIEMTVTDAGTLGGGASDFFVSIGGSAPFETYKGTFASATYTFGIRSPKTNNLLTITPHKDFTGTVSDISLKEITLFTTPTAQLLDSNNQTSLHMRTGKAPLKNIFIGENSGRMNTTGEQNVSLGNKALDFNTTGFWNVVMGHEAMRDNTVGTRNVALGRIALAQNISGDRNVAIGSWALTRNTTGRANIGIGADAHYFNTIGSNNVAIGLVAMGGNTKGDNNIAIGERTMAGSDGGENNLALGRLALYYNKGDANIGLGMQSLYRNLTGDNNIAMGWLSLALNESGNGNLALGRFSLRNNNSSYNVGLGYQTLYRNENGARNIAVGQDSLFENLTGNDNIGLGFESLYNSLTDQNIAIGRFSLRDNEGEFNVALGTSSLRTIKGNRNVGVGYNVASTHLEGDFNVFLGSNAGRTSVSGESNILIGYDVNKSHTAASNELNIGNVIKSKDMTSGILEIPKLQLSDLPTTDPSESGMIWNDNGTLKISG